MNPETQAIQKHIKAVLENKAAHLLWQTERSRDRADISGRNSRGQVYIELEMKREDPVANVAKHVRRVSTSAEIEAVKIYHVFSQFYYDPPLGFDSRRKDAVFVGELASKEIPGISYQPMKLDILPPRKSESSLPDSYPEKDTLFARAEAVAETIAKDITEFQPPDGEQLSDY